MRRLFSQKKQAELDFEQTDFDDLPCGNYGRFELNLSEKTVVQEIIEERGCDFPSVNPLWVGKQHRYLYASAGRTPAENGPLQAIMKLDKKSRGKTIMECNFKRFSW